MDIRKLKYFITVAEELHFNRAAEKLNMTQPPLSQQIQNLEEEIGVQLLERSKRTVLLTPAGKVFLNEARRIVRQLEQSIEKTRLAGEGMVGQLSIAFVDSASGEWLVRLLRIFRELYPQVQLILREMTSAEQIQALQDGTIHFGFVRYSEPVKHVRYQTVQHESLIAVLPEDHALALENEVSIRNLAAEAFILFPRQFGAPFYDQIMQFCKNHEVDPKVVQEAVQMSTIVNLVAAGMGISIIPSSASIFERKGVVFLPFQEVTPSVPLFAAWRTDVNQAVIANFLSLLSNLD